MKSIRDIREGDEVVLNLKVVEVADWNGVVKIEVQVDDGGYQYFWIDESIIQKHIPNWKPEEGKLVIWDGYEVLVKHIIGDEAWIQRVKPNTQHVVRLSELTRS